MSQVIKTVTCLKKAGPKIDSSKRQLQFIHVCFSLEWGPAYKTKIIELPYNTLKLHIISQCTQGISSVKSGEVEAE